MSQDASSLMDRIYRHQRHIYDLTRKYYLLGRDGLIRDLDPPPGGTVLEIGCGTGRNLIAIARRYPGVTCYGLDVSAAMLETARAAIARAGLTARIHLAVADATAFEPRPLFGVAAFDRVVISYALSMIPPWRAVLEKAGGALAEDGQLHIVDFGDQHGLPASFKRLLHKWLAQFHVQPRADLGAAVTRLAQSRGWQVAGQHRFRGYAYYARLRRC